MIVLEDDVPGFLRSSTYLLELVKDEPFPAKGIEVPKRCAKKDMSVKTEEDLIELLDTLRFWLVPELAERSTELMSFVFNHANIVSLRETCREYERDIPFLKDVLKVATSTSYKRIEAAAAIGNVSILQFACKSFGVLVTEFDSTSLPPKGYRYSAVELAARGGHTECLQYLLEHATPVFPLAIVFAAFGGHLECVKLLTERCRALFLQGYSTLRNAFLFAALNGHVGCLRYMRTMYAEPARPASDYDKQILRGALEGNRVNVLQFAVVECGVPLIQFERRLVHIIDCADCTDCLMYLHSVGVSIRDPNLLREAAHTGNLVSFQLLLKYGCEWQGTEICTSLVRSNYLECLKCAHAAGLSWDARTCAIAAEYGHIECLKYLHENGCPWDARTCAAAASGDNFDCLIYAHQNGCPWNASTSRECTSLKCFAYLVMHGCLGTEKNHYQG